MAGGLLVSMGTRWIGRSRRLDQAYRQGDEGVEEVVEFVFVAEVGPDLFADGGDGGGVDFAGFVRSVRPNEVARARRSSRPASSR